MGKVVYPMDKSPYMKNCMSACYEEDGKLTYLFTVPYDIKAEEFGEMDVGLNKLIELVKKGTP